MTRAPAYTDEQAVAIARRGVNVALDAGAGCGKTFVLTERLLSHLAPGDDTAALHELVAITFTDAAAREMRQRVREKCLALVTGAQDGQGDHWLRLLRSLDAARVMTIHAFCSTIVRAHALELGIDPAFRVLDQPAADVLLSEATDDQLRVLLERRDEDVRTLAAEFGVGGLKSRLAPLRDAARGADLGEWLGLSPGEVVDRWRSYHTREVAPLELQSLAALSEIDDVLSLMGRATPRPEAASMLDELQQLLHALRDGAVSDEDLERIVQLARVQGVCGRKEDWPSPEAKKEYGDACTKLRQKIEKRQLWADADVQHTAAELGQRLARVAGAVFAAYDGAKREAGALDFDDLQREARRLLTEPEFRDAQRRVRREIKLLLVDEFQDTDQLQVDIVRALAGEGRLFFVGDFKQSIYRFRGAQPRVFRNLRERTPPEGRLPLSMNFRSQPAVLEFVNALFEPKFAPDYVPLKPSRPQLAARPGAEFLWTEVPEKASAETARRREAASIAARVQELLDDPTPRVAELQDGEWVGRRVTRGDIAVLFRALSDVQHYEQALRDAGVDYHLVGGHAFYSQQEVYDVLNLLRSVVSTCDDVSLAGALRSPMFALEDETLLWLARAGGSLNAGLASAALGDNVSQTQRERVAAARETLAELRAMRGAAGTAEVLRVALERTGYDATLLAEFLGERKLANLDKIIEQARAADEARPGDLDAFVRQLSEFIAWQPKEALAATTSEDADVVRLMTVHHAKGLEFPVVVVADLDRKTRSDSSSAAFDPRLGPLVKPQDSRTSDAIGINLYKTVQTQHERDELARLFYVACTRAADYLILSSAVEDLQKPKGEWLKSLSEAFNLQTGAPLRGRSDEPLVSVNQRRGAGRGAAPSGRGADLPKALDGAQARARRGECVSREALPLGVEPRRLRTFSVSRLTGRVHYRADHRRPDDPLMVRSEGVDPIGLGTLVHAVLERLDLANPTGVAEWCEALAPLHVRRNADRTAADASALVTRFFEADQGRALARAARVEREVEFLLAWPPGEEGPNAQLQGYIDCLYADPDGAWRVLDYKTNQVSAADVPRAAEDYRVQLAVYALAVEQALGARPAALEVFFLRPGTIHTFPWDDEARAAAIRDISKAIQDARLTATQHG